MQTETLESNAIILAPRFTVAPVGVAPAILADIDEALAIEALLGKVTNADENQRAVDAQARQKAVLKKIEAARKAIKEPFLEMCRAIDSKAVELSEELEKECGRLNSLTVPWGIQERRRLQEEAEAQQRELQRIEAERQAEIDRLAQEQAARDKAAAYALALATQLASEAETANTPETIKAAADAAITAGRAAQVAKNAAIEVAAMVEKVEERAGTAAYLSSRPIVADTAKGQKLAQDWEITVTDPYALAKYHPNAVTIKPLIGAIKEMLREGIKVQGITAVETVNTAVRAKRERPAIDL
jgi:hypothetical protein